MNQLQLLHSLETIRDLLGPIIQDRDSAKLTNPKGLIEAHRTAHYSCEATYADLEAEAHAMNLAQGADAIAQDFLDDYNSDWSKKARA